MKKFKIILAALLCACGLQASAQEAGDTVTFNPHWFISAHGDVQYTLGEAKFGDLLSPTVQVAAGYRFNPWLSARLSVGAWQSKGGWSGYRVNGVPTTKTYKYNYVAPAVDVMFNLSNAVCGYNPDRVFNLTAFLGAWREHRLRQRRGQRTDGPGLQPALQLGGHQGARRWPRRPRA